MLKENYELNSLQGRVIIFRRGLSEDFEFLNKIQLIFPQGSEIFFKSPLIRAANWHDWLAWLLHRETND